VFLRGKQGARRDKTRALAGAGVAFLGGFMADVNAGKRLIGAAVPVGALRSKESVGVGEFPDLVEFARLAIKLEIGIIQLLPVNDTGNESSPYFALSAFALNPVYLRISSLPGSEAFAARLSGMRAEFEKEKRFPYKKIYAAKINLLRDIYEAGGKKIEKDEDFNKWLSANKWIASYAVYRVLKEENGMKAWQEWSSCKNLSKKEIEALWNSSSKRSAHLFWAYVQFYLDKQLREAAREASALGVILKGDLPILMNEDSADVWANPEIFVQELSAGAPPDMYSASGQNWGFPLYNWEEQEKDGFAWWKERLTAAERYYGAYRIDHVLGFFRIWATSKENFSAALGRYVKSQPVKKADFKALGYDAGRIRWITEPHIPTRELEEAVFGGGGGADDVKRVFALALDRVGNEELWTFKKSIKGEKDVHALDIHSAAKNYLCLAWGNRIFLEYDKDSYAPLWYYKTSRAYLSLSGEEKTALDGMLEKKTALSMKNWEACGKKLLSILVGSSPMIPCAEDLGAVPACVPKTLARLKIFALRVTRWNRKWEEEGAPYVPFYDYPELSVCTPAVHDSSTVREWWEREAEQERFAHFIGAPSLPRIYNPGTARIILKAIASAASRWRVFQIQDLLHLSPRWYAENPQYERVNVPGVHDDFNWTYRLPATICEIADDTDLIGACKELSFVKKASKQKNGK
jgi:4-alpha-glucanotransferase